MCGVVVFFASGVTKNWLNGVYNNNNNITYTVPNETEFFVFQSSSGRVNSLSKRANNVMLYFHLSQIKRFR